MRTEDATSRTRPRQRLLYLHARTPSVFSEILGLTRIEPIQGYTVEITADGQDWPYRMVHDALVDGWQIVQFPHSQAPIDDENLDMIGYEFILHKLEVVHEP